MSLAQPNNHSVIATQSEGVSSIPTFINSMPKMWQAGIRDGIGDPVEDKDLLWYRSPINHVENIRTPLLVIQGAKDPRVVKSESDQIVEKLKKLSRPVSYVVFEDEGHGFSRNENYKTAIDKIIKFLNRYLGG